MPIYEYECGSCGERFEVTQKFSDPLLSTCRLCNAAGVRKVLSPMAFVLKGSGWYVTDYPSSDRKNAGKSENLCKKESKPASGCTTGACASGTCASKS
jgi:putative FmdB family regulatory protein